MAYDVSKSAKTDRHSIILNTLFAFGILLVIALSIYGPIRKFAAPKEQDKASLIEGTSGQTLPDFSLLDQNGKEITRSDFLGKLWVANFIFTRCTVSCPKMTAQMASLQDSFRGDPHIKFASFSVDPEYDTTAVLNEFAKTYRAEHGQWFFITGTKDLIYRLAHEFFHLSAGEYSEEDKRKGAEEILHSERFVLLGPGEKILGYFNGLDAKSMDDLKTEIIHLRKTGFG